ncbi:MAG: 2-hydroxychromene-2-carboxylate isomerase [Burkholderiales bacterium]|jgi:2-hydroxychromene-2-carboxylate isomerase
MKTLRWYFDYISPYAYLQSTQLARFDGLARIEYRPILFAGLLNHHGQKGPAEIPAKKVQTFRQVVWLAHRHGIALNLPSAHPFNPLPMLRLSIALDDDPDVVRALFRYVWVDGHLPTDEDAWATLCATLGVDDPAAEIARADVKETLRRNTEEAIAIGAFGVPTIAVDDQLFWGFDMTEAALACLGGDPLFASPEMRRAAELPDGVHRVPR